MYLFIDSSDDKKIVLKLGVNNNWVQANFNVDEYYLLQAIDKMLVDRDASLRDIAGLAVLVGRGRFTATRIAVTIANTLAFVLNVRVAAVREFSDNIGKAIIETKLGRLISAEYSGEANVGIKK